MSCATTCNYSSLTLYPEDVTWVPLGTVGRDLTAACRTSMPRELRATPSDLLASRMGGRSTLSAATTLRGNVDQQRGVVNATCGLVRDWRDTAASVEAEAHENDLAHKRPA